MIASGEKKEEYREIKPYWISRLCAWNNAYDPCRDFTAVKFRNGYQKNAPEIMVECVGIDIGFGHEKWGGGYKEVFVIKLGSIIQTPK